MNHTYFFKSLDWQAKGTYYDDKGNEFPLEGEVSILRNEESWTLGGFLEVKFEKAVRFTNDYCIYETKDKSTLDWQSYNPALGTLEGKFEIIGNSIISHYKSKDGVYSGTETLIQIDEKTYYNVGVSFCNNIKMSSWTAILKCKE